MEFIWQPAELRTALCTGGGYRVNERVSGELCVWVNLCGEPNKSVRM